MLDVSTEVTVGGVGEGEEVIPVITTPPFWWIERMIQLRLTPQNNHLYDYPLVLSTLRYSVGVMHSNAGTLGEIVVEHVHTERFMRKNGI